MIVVELAYTTRNELAMVYLHRVIYGGGTRTMGAELNKLNFLVFAFLTSSGTGEYVGRNLVRRGEGALN